MGLIVNRSGLLVSGRVCVQQLVVGLFGLVVVVVGLVWLSKPKIIAIIGRDELGIALRPNSQFMDRIKSVGGDWGGLT